MQRIGVLLALMGCLPWVALGQSAETTVSVAELFGGNSVPIEVADQDGVSIDNLQLTGTQDDRQDDRRGVELGWKMKVQGGAGSDSLVTFRLFFEGGVDFDAFLIPDLYTEVPILFGQGSQAKDLDGSFRITPEEVRQLEDGGDVKIRLEVTRTPIEKLAGLPSAVPGLSGSLLRDIRALESENRLLEELVDNLRVTRGPNAPAPDPRPQMVQVETLATGVTGRGQDPEKPKDPLTAAEYLNEHLSGHHGEQEAVEATCVIATLPDPVDSRLAREFDLMLSSIRRGVEDLGTGQVLHSSYLPWSLKNGPEKGWHREQPGLVIFHTEAGPNVILLLVGEVPGAGVHHRAMEEALRLSRDDAANVCRCQSEVLVLGPTFSGSRTSLQPFLRTTRTPSHFPRRFRLASGSATSRKNVEYFDGLGAEFKSIPNHDRDTACSIMEFLEHRLGVTSSEVVLLAESSLYGVELEKELKKCSDNGSPHPIHVSVVGNERLWRLGVPQVGNKQEREARSSKGDSKANPGDGGSAANQESTGLRVESFPAQIALMRVESNRRRAELYSDDVAQGNGSPKKPSKVAAGGSNASATGLAAQAPLLTARTQELVFSNQLQKLAQSKPKVIWIVATDPRDKLYLAELVREYVPGAFLLTQESDYLLTHPDYREATRGMLVVSTIAEEKRRKDANEHGNDWALGAYLAVQKLLLVGDVASPEMDQGISAIDDRCTELKTAATTAWEALSKALPNVCDQAGFGSGIRRLIASTWGALRKAPNSAGSAPLIGWLLLVVMLFAARHVRDFYRSIKPRLRELEAEWRYGIFLVLLVSACLGVVALALSPSLVGANGWLAQGVAWLIISPLIVVLLQNFFSFAEHLFLTPVGDYIDNWWRQWPTVTVAGVRNRLGSLLGLVVLAVPWYLLFLQWGSIRQLFSNPSIPRGVAFSSGVSPLVPLLVFSGVAAAWTILAMRRLLDADHIDPASDVQDPGRTLFVPFSSWIQIWSWGAVALLILVVYFAWHYGRFDGILVHSVEGRSFGLLITALFVLGIFLVVVSAVRTYKAWQSLRRFINKFSPALHGFDSFLAKVVDLREKDEAVSFAVRRANLDEVRRWAQALREDSPVRQALSQQGLGAALDSALSQDEGTPNAEQIYQIRQAFSDVLFRLGPALHHRRSREILENLAEKEKGSAQGQALTIKGDRDVAAVASSCNDLQPLRKFLAVELGLYATRCSRHLRALLAFVTGGSVALLLAVTSYPFEPRSALVLFTTIGVIVGAVFSGWLLVRLEKDPVLSWLAGTESGKVGWDRRSFLGRMLYHEGLPLFSMAATQIPAVPALLANWIQPLLRIIAP